MPAAPPVDWIETLWPAVCARAARPLAGLLLPREDAGEVAEEVFDDFLDGDEPSPATWEGTAHWLTSRVTPRAVKYIADQRMARGDPDFGRDGRRRAWLKNPDMSQLLRRDAGGALISPEWSHAEPVLRSRAIPILMRMGIGEDDAQDVYMESVAELLRPRLDAGPLEKMRVFEELPRFFATMIERRGISWQRRQSARKRQADNPALGISLNDAAQSLAATLADPRSITGNPWESATFDRIFKSCRRALTDFEWHLINALFVEGTHTRLELASDSWVLDQLGIREGSESKRRRRLNLYIEEALARLGRALESADV